MISFCKYLSGGRYLQSDLMLKGVGSFLYVKEEEGENYMENSGVSFLHVLTFIFIILKVAGVVSWSWWLVLLPSLFYFLAMLGVMLVVGAVALVMFDKNKDKYKDNSNKK